jgi:hypothetical protein
MSGGKALIGLGFLSLIGSVVIAYSNNIFTLPWSPSLVLASGTLIFIACSMIGSALIWFDTSWMTPLHRQQMPYTPDRDTIARVLTSDINREECLIYGKPESTVREAVKDDWPFERKLKSKDWYIIDERGMDVSERNLSDTEGTLKLVLQL